MKARLSLAIIAIVVVLALATAAFAVQKARGAAAKGGPPKVGAMCAAGGHYLKTFAGKSVSLNSMLQKGPVLLVFYMGDACPVCNRQLQSFQSSYPQFKAKGIQILAVSADKPDLEAKTVARDKISFTCASDPSMTFVKSWGAVMKPNPPTASPAYFLIGRNGKIVWEKIGPEAESQKGADGLTKEVLSFNFTKAQPGKPSQKAY